MVEAKTYANRSNARRAAVAAGNLVGRVEITVMKSADGVRFGWKSNAPPLPDADEQLLTTVKTTVEKAPGMARLKRNGVKRPAPGGLCAAVWAWLDVRPGATVKELKSVAPCHGWNINNAACEFYMWRKFQRHQ